MTMERLENFSVEVTEGRSGVRAEEERIERGGWTSRTMKLDWSLSQSF